MGTSKSLSTPSGGAWTPVKIDITGALGGNTDVTPGQIVGGTIAAAGGLLGPIAIVGGSATTTSARRSPAAGARDGQKGGAGAAGSRRSRAAVGRALSRLSGFGSAVQASGLDEGLHALGLDALRGRPAAEVISAIADHLASSAEGLAGEILSAALRESIFEAAGLAGDPTYENLEAALQGFLASDGVEGLAELFLANLAFDRVWSLIENHAEQKSETAADSKALSDAIQHCCRAEASRLVNRLRAEGRSASVDWFGRDGQRFGNDIAGLLEAQLFALKN